MNNNTLRTSCICQCEVGTFFYTFPPSQMRRLCLSGSWGNVQEQGITDLGAEYKGGLIAGKLKGLWEVNRGEKSTQIIPIF